jgi:hypothetical protein
MNRTETNDAGYRVHLSINPNDYHPYAVSITFPDLPIIFISLTTPDAAEGLFDALMGATEITVDGG